MNSTSTSTPKVEGTLHAAQRKIAYLLSCYPAVSHTFLLNEIAELRRLGFTIDTLSINPPLWSAGELPAREAAELRQTLYIKTMSKPRILLLLLKTLLRHPPVVARGLWAALKLDPWSLRNTLYAVFYLVEAFIVGDYLRKSGHRHLHVHFGGPVATVGMLTSIAWGIPYSVMFHGPEEFYEVNQAYLPLKVAQASFVLCISDYCRSQVMKLSDPAHWNKLQVLRLGVDPEVFRPGDARKETSCIEIVCVGRLVPAKGQLMLLEAAEKLLQRGHTFRLRLAGGGADRSRLESFIAERGLGSSVVLEGPLSHEATHCLLKEADIFVLASFAEGLPVALMEAMAMEIPCISTYVAGIPELIRDGLEGLLVPASSLKDLTAALERLILEPSLRTSLAKAGRRRVRELYNLEKNTCALANALDERLASSRANHNSHARA